MYADLHIHTVFSDGTLTPEEAALRCHEKGVGLAAVADHDCWEGCGRFAAACAPLGIKTAFATELQCNHRGLHLHILAYGFDPEGEIKPEARRCRRLMLDMSDDLIERMAVDHPALDPAEYAVYEYDRAKGGWAGIHYLLDKGVTKSLAGGFRFYSMYGCDYTDYPFPSLSGICGVIRASGGLPVLAHPGNWYNGLSQAELTAELEIMYSAGIGGVECWYPANSPAVTGASLAFCRKRGLAATAGCDCHGDFNRVDGNGVEYDIGITKTPEDELLLGPLADMITE